MRIFKNMNIMILMVPVRLWMVLNQTNNAFFHSHLMEQTSTLASLGDIGLDPGVQLKKLMKGVIGDIAAKNAQKKVVCTE